jgi:hypothetical protein
MVFEEWREDYPSMTSNLILSSSKDLQEEKNDLFV